MKNLIFYLRTRLSILYTAILKKRIYTMNVLSCKVSKKSRFVVGFSAYHIVLFLISYYFALVFNTLEIVPFFKKWMYLNRTSTFDNYLYLIIPPTLYSNHSFLLYHSLYLHESPHSCSLQTYKP